MDVLDTQLKACIDGASATRATYFAGDRFNRNDVLYWLANEPSFGRQAVYLDDRVDVAGGDRLGCGSDDGQALPLSAGRLIRGADAKAKQLNAGPA